MVLIVAFLNFVVREIARANRDRRSLAIIVYQVRHLHLRLVSPVTHGRDLFVLPINRRHPVLAVIVDHHRRP